MLYEQVGEVKRLGKEWHVYEIKGLLEIYNEILGITEFKPCFLKKAIPKKKGATIVKFYGTSFYKFGDEITHEYSSLVKRGKREGDFKLKIITVPGNTISEEKKQNVMFLLDKQFNKDGVRWEYDPEFEFYKSLLTMDQEATAEEAVDETAQECDCLEIEHCVCV